MPKTNRIVDLTLDEILDAFRRHGEDGELEEGATHEVGDLQDFCTALWKKLTKTQRKEVLSDDNVQELIGSATGGYDDSKGTVELPDEDAEEV
jgi:hypothetical protein